MIFKPVIPVTINDYPVDVMLLHESQSEHFGNKRYKLHYNLIEAKKNGFDTILSFGGAFSNHIHALAVLGKAHGFKTIGVIRGEDDPENPTLRSVREHGMSLYFVSRDVYRSKNQDELNLELKEQFGEFYLLPEGGTNYLAVKGCSEILTEVVSRYDKIFCPVGTGGTIAGLISTPGLSAEVEGIVVLKGATYLQNEIEQLVFSEPAPWKLNHDYHLGGYAKYNAELIEFIRNFKKEFQIQTDPVYNAKMFYAISNMLKKQLIPSGKRILALHTGGLQGIAGWEYRFGKL